MHTKPGKSLPCPRPPLLFRLDLFAHFLGFLSGKSTTTIQRRPRKIQPLFRSQPSPFIHTQSTAILFYAMHVQNFFTRHEPSPAGGAPDSQGTSPAADCLSASRPPLRTPQMSGSALADSTQNQTRNHDEI